VDITRGEMVEGDLNRLIDKPDRDRRRDEGERAREELYKQSTRRHAERQQRQRGWEWLRHHERMIGAHAANLEALIGKHRKEAERYAELLGVESIDEISKRNGHKRGEAA
jgi:hypothetical protein